MSRGRLRRCLAATLAAAAMLWGPRGATAQELDSRLGEAVLTVPSGGFTEPELEVTVYRPPGEGPFPVAVINHGRAAGSAKLQPRYRPALAAREFVQRGWAVVVPMRQGFSQSGGSEISAGCNVHSNGLQQARSVRRTLDWLATQPWADVQRNVVLGQSHGGLTTLAYGTAPHPGTRLLVNFAGGLRQESCAGWQQNLARAIGDYGADTRLPSLWFYGDNDSYFPPFVWRGAHERYTQAGGRADLVAGAELLHCAAHVASLVFAPCAGFEALKPDATEAQRAYANYLRGQLVPAQIALLPTTQQGAAARSAADPNALQGIDDPMSLLVAAGVLLQTGKANPATVAQAVDTASSQGWRRPLLAWLGVQLQRALQAGQTAEAERVQRRIQLVTSETAVAK